MFIYVGADHKGFALKKNVVDYLKRAGYDVEDVGDDHLDPDDDFPIFAARAVTKVLSSSDTDPRAILICGSGQGMMMAANRFNRIRAGLGWSAKAAKDTRSDEDSNVLAMPGELFATDKQQAYVIIETWLATASIEAPRFRRRNKQLDELQNG